MKKIVLLFCLGLISGCSTFSSCDCEKQVEENKRLIIPKELTLPQPK